MSDSKPGVRPVIPALLLRPLRQAPRLGSEKPSPTPRWPFAPRQARQGQARRHRPDARGAGSAGGLPHRHRARLRHRRGGDGDVVAAGRAAGRCWPGRVSAKAGSPTSDKAAEAEGCRGRRSRIWRTARSVEGRFGKLTWCSPGTAPPPACTCRTATGSRKTAKGLTICDATSAVFAHEAVGQARCRHLLLAEGAGRRGGARHAVAVARAPSSGWKATRRPGRCRRSSGMTKGGKLNEGIFVGETINTPSMLCVED